MEKKQFFSEAIVHVKEAVRLKPEGVEGHFWLAANYGEYGQAKGVLKSLFLRNDIIRELNEAVRLDDQFDCGAAYIVLGRIYFKVPPIFGGSLEKSRTYLEKARKICPRVTTTLLYLAETYWELKEKTLAVRTLEQLLEVEPYPAAIPEARLDKSEAEKLLRQYKKT